MPCDLYVYEIQRFSKKAPKLALKLIRFYYLQIKNIVKTFSELL